MIGVVAEMTPLHTDVMDPINVMSHHMIGQHSKIVLTDMANHILHHMLQFNQSAALGLYHTMDLVPGSSELTQAWAADTIFIECGGMDAIQVVVRTSIITDHGWYLQSGAVQ